MLFTVPIGEGYSPRLEAQTSVGFLPRDKVRRMTEYRHGAHTVFRIHLHVVWTTKYRTAVMTGEVGLRLRELIREICGRMEVTLSKGQVAKDHVHLFISIPPQVTISRLVQALTGKSSYKMLPEFPHLAQKFWGRPLWARGYFYVSSGNVTDEVIREYIEPLGREQDADFRVEGEPDAS